MTYLTEERLLIRDQAREFAMREVLPIANQLDPVKGTIPMDLRHRMAEMGYFGIMLPEKYGGLGWVCLSTACGGGVGAGLDERVLLNSENEYDSRHSANDGGAEGSMATHGRPRGMDWSICHV